MPKDHDDGRDERQHNNLAEALCALTCELFEHRKLKLSELDLLRAGLATKRDLIDAKHDIIKAFGERVSPAKLDALTKELKAHADPLAKAVAENQPTTSG